MAQYVIVPQAASARFPGCALSCATLLQAETVCRPPYQPTTNQLVYDQCFCNSAFLTPFATTTDGVCVAECTLLADRQQLQAWFNGFCATVRQGVDPTTITATAATTIATATVTATSGTVIATVTPTSSSTSSTSQSSISNKTWIEVHWKWIVMLAVLIIGLGLLTWLAVWLKRRHRRKLEKSRAAASGFGYDPEKRPASDPRRSATPDLWGPHQMMQATKGYGYETDGTADQSTARASKRYRGTESAAIPEKDTIDTPGTDQRGFSARPTSTRARPSELEMNARMIGAADRRSKSKRSISRIRSQRRREKEAEVALPTEHHRSNNGAEYQPQDLEKT